jgi:hypothetical protein
LTEYLNWNAFIHYLVKVCNQRIIYVMQVAKLPHELLNKRLHTDLLLIEILDKTPGPAFPVKILFFNSIKHTLASQNESQNYCTLKVIQTQRKCQTIQKRYKD